MLEVIKTPSDLSWGNNKAQDILQIAALELDAKIAYLEEKVNNAMPAASFAIALLKKAVDKQDQLVYDEPIPWPPVREALGAVYYLTSQYSQAENVFKKDLDLLGIGGKIDRRANPNNGRSLFGLYMSLEAQKKPCENIKSQFDKTWKNADVVLQMSDLF